MIKKFALAAVAAVLAFGLTACDMGTETTSQQDRIENRAAKGETYEPKNNVEKNNYERAQKLYDSPNSIIWCTTTWGNANAPLLTVPIAGKLTSSSVSYFSNYRIKVFGANDSAAQVENRSVDGMYHGNPGPYRYGFTPGGQYVDFTNMPTFCTTSLTKFQREETNVTITVAGSGEQSDAEKALKDGDPKAAQNALKDLETK